MRFHLLALPNVQTTKEYSLDGFCGATIKFARILKGLGHTVYLYASEENEAPCDELITVITKQEQKTLLDKIPYQYATMEEGFPLWSMSNPRIIAQIAKRKQSKDFICMIGGISQKVIADAHPDLMTVEYSIGYIHSFSQYRVYESQTWRHCTHGFQNNQQGRNFETVIPYFFDENQFEFRAEKEPYAVYVGRLTSRKGIATACRMAMLAGMNLRVVGHGDMTLVTDGAEYMGALPEQEKNQLIAGASALLSPTEYLEPFGSAVVEAQLCGTPVITTDFGAFVETVEQGKTGFRCNYMGEFVRALKEVNSLDRNYIRKRAIDKYSMSAVAPQYQAYFDRLMLLWQNGWNTI